MEKNKVKNKNGISMVSLLVAILIMAIITTAAIATLNEGEIVNDTKTATNLRNMDAVEERFNVLKNTYITDNFGSITIEKYITFLLDKGEIVDAGSANQDGSKSVRTTNGYIVTIAQDGESNLVINVEGLYQECAPTIDYVKLIGIDDGFTISVNLKRGVYVEYIYSYKLPAETEYTIINTVPTKDTYKKITGLDSGVTYDIKIEATNMYGTIQEEYSVKTK